MTVMLQTISSVYSFSMLDTWMYYTPMNYQPRPTFMQQGAYSHSYFLAWPISRQWGGDSPVQTVAVTPAYDPFLQANWFSGGGGLLKFNGITRDSGGSVLGNTLVQLFHTSDDAFIQQQTTDSTGEYNLYSPYGDAHYLVAYKAGSPDVAGTTVNTLTGV